MFVVCVFAFLAFHGDCAPPPPLHVDNGASGFDDPLQPISSGHDSFAPPSHGDSPPHHGSPEEEGGPQLHEAPPLVDMTPEKQWEIHYMPADGLHEAPPEMEKPAQSTKLRMRAPPVLQNSQEHGSHDDHPHSHSHSHNEELLIINGKVMSPDDQIIHHGSHTHTVGEAKRDAGYIFGVMMIVMIVAQASLFYWQKFHASSFQVVSLLGLWAIPAIWSFSGAFVRMLVIWTAFSCVNGRIIFIATRKPIGKQTPRKVYTWFFLVYKFCYALAVAGNVLVVLDLFGFADLVFPKNYVGPAGFLLIFYGLYFGVLGRDCAVLCAARMASTMGYTSTKDGDLPCRQLQRNICAVCDCTLFQSLRLDEDDSKNENVFTLNCGHQFHESCIRGWMIVGKRDICPNCSEKVNLKEVFTNPWETQSIAWGAILDGLRYLVVYNPVICIVMQLVLYVVY